MSCTQVGSTLFEAKSSNFTLIMYSKKNSHKSWKLKYILPSFRQHTANIFMGMKIDQKRGLHDTQIS